MVLAGETPDVFAHPGYVLLPPSHTCHVNEFPRGRHWADGYLNSVCTSRRLTPPDAIRSSCASRARSACAQKL